jgi:Fe-S cluster assembly ATP-binding protein
MTLLDVEGLVFRADGRAILAGVDLAVAAGEIHALLGANGSGKTTLARVVMGSAGYAPSSGRIRFLGHDLLPLAMHERARLGIALAWQELARFEGLLVRDFLALGGAKLAPDEALRRVGLEPQAYLERAVDKRLSAGERKRIELASIFALRPRLAMLDEPAAGIDLASLEEIATVITELKRDARSVLLITHVESIARIADRASFLCCGRVAFTGDPQSAAERYKARRCIVCDGRTCSDEPAG